MAAQHPIDGRAGHAEVVAKPMGTLAAPPGGQHLTHLGGRERVGAAVGPRGPVGQPSWTLCLIAGQPL
jgi:hypothetical protein